MKYDGDYPALVVSVGTDHHKFDRLIDWVEDWLDSRTDHPTCLIQHGASKAPELARGVLRMPREDLLQLYASAKIVLVQGGPGSILDARSVGHLPIAVPRLPRLNEVVDGHQVAFTRTMASHGEAIAAESEEELMRALNLAMSHPESMRTAPRLSTPAASANLLGAAIAGLDHHADHMALRRMRQLLAHH
ncbi:glycosyltransferase [Arthrobacter glacialis]|uniref:Glycosyl transferase n=1 Tax=Arthrobacter glacialis TaxID=1664 RepID=A0A2S4A065_ARTGL|nr:glycosyltransferase [Arthrobacter glacialis]POH74880.1 glycosyl transferase [Arthrobacter glacialis]